MNAGKTNVESVAVNFYIVSVIQCNKYVAVELWTLHYHNATCESNGSVLTYYASAGSWYTLYIHADKAVSAQSLLLECNHATLTF